MRKSRFKDRCFVAIVLLAFAMFFSGVAASFMDTETRLAGVTFLLPDPR